jgi:RNA polymerase sigma-70 factor, ECF subfamily
MNANTDYTEQEVLSRLSAGDQSAHRILFNAHYKNLLSTAYRLVPDTALCKDLVQEVFIDLWTKRAEIKIHTGAAQYLRRAVINKTLNYIKQNRRYILNEPEDWNHVSDDSAQEIDHKLTQEDRESALHQAIELLPEKCKLVFMLSRFEKMSHKEIADHLNISTKTIENQITKAMKVLKTALVHQHELSAIILLMLNSLR